MYVNKTGGATGAAFGGVSNNGSMMMLSPESLVALCAMQLNKFDNEILSRMSEKDQNMQLQEKLAGLTTKLQALGSEGLTSRHAFERSEIVKEMNEILQLIGNDPNKQDLKANLESQLKILESEKNPENVTNSYNNYKEKADKTKAERDKLDDASKNGAIHVEGYCIDWNTGNINESSEAYTNLTDAQKSYMKARSEEHKSYLAAEKARVGAGNLSADQIKGLTEYIKSAGASISSRNDTIMMELQTLVSQRSTSIQMTSNLTNSLLESAKTIASNIGR